MSTLSELAKSGRTVVCSIHQPRSSIYQMLDTVLLLSGGCPMYYGRAGTAVDRYFDAAGFPIPSSFNPSDFLLDTISVDYRSEKVCARSVQGVCRMRVVHVMCQGCAGYPQVYTMVMVCSGCSDTNHACTVVAVILTMRVQWLRWY